jgi:hypothetical protein
LPSGSDLRERPKVKLVRIPFAVSLALLAAAPIAAAVAPPKPPVAESADRDRNQLQGQAIATGGESKPAETSIAPAETRAPAPADAGKRDLPNLRTWLGGLSLPTWLTDSGLPAWAWILLAFLAFMLLRGLFRRDDRSDLVGPPRAMRLGARPSPTPIQPRRADPPQRP